MSQLKCVYIIRQLGTGNVENAEHRKTLGVCTCPANSYNVEFSCAIQEKVGKLFVCNFNAKCIIRDYEKCCVAQN